MKKKVLSMLIVFTMVFSVLPSTALAAFEPVSGDGDSNNYYKIENDTDLLTFAQSVNAGNSYEGQTIKLMNSITMPEGFMSIGNGSRSGNSYSGNAFKGTFDGGDKTISGLTSPLFGVVDGGTVKDVNLIANINEASGDGAAAVAVLVGGTVDDVDVSGTVTAVKAAGGVVGRMLAIGTISNCDNTAVVTSTGSSDAAGGIVGKAYYTSTSGVMNITNCTNAGAITGGYAAGGIAGFSAANIGGCTNNALITAATEAGGVVGEQTMYGTVQGNTNSGLISNAETGGTAYGGIVGWARYANSTTDYLLYSTIDVSDNTNSGSISAPGASLGSGGIVGSIYNQATVTGNTNTAESIVGGTFASGIVGGAQAADNNVSISGATISASNNVTTTALNAISANCVASDMYNNDPTTFEAENNSDAWVAQVGSDKYATLQAAIDATGSGDTITLLSDITLTESVVVAADDSVILDLAGKTISQSVACTEHYAMITNIGTLTIKDSSTTETSVGTGKISFTDTGAGDPNFGWGSYTIANYGGTLTVDGGTIEHLGEQNPGNGQPNVHMYCAIFQYSGSTTINDGTISTPTYRSARLWKGNMTINGGTFGGQVWVQCVDNTAELTINGGTFAPCGSDGSSVFVSNSNYTVTFSVTDGTFTTKIGCSDAPALASCITGGTFSSAAKENTDSTLIASGYTFGEEADSAGYYGIIIDPEQDVFEAAIEGVGYTTLQAAINAAQSGDTVTLLTDVTYAGSNRALIKGKTLTIDLGGYAVTGEYVAINIKNGADVSLKNGTVRDTTSDACAVQVLGAKATLAEDLDVIADYGAAVTIYGKDGYETILTTYADLTTNDPEYDAAISGQGAYDGTVINIAGGTLNSATGVGIYHPQNGTLNITGGTITANTGIIMKSGTLNITGGTINSTGAKVDYEYRASGYNLTGDAVVIENVGGDTGYEAITSVSITGGTFTSANAAAVASYAATAANSDAVAVTSFISDGTYSDNSAEAYLAEGYTLESYVNGEGKTVYGVEPVYVVTITIPEGAAIVVKDSEGNEVSAEDDGTYKLSAGTYSYSVSKSGYYTENAEFNVTDSAVTRAVTLSVRSSGGGSYTPSYSITAEETENGSISLSPKNASSGTTVTITVDPDTGYVLETLTVLDKNGDEIELTKKADDEYTFKMPSGKVTVEATFVEDNTMLNYFTDVLASDYYYDAVLWAVKNGITKGTSAATFGPGNPCTRAQMATFLWRAAGSPEPLGDANPFVDVSADAYYAKAVQWAYEQGITGGTSAATFSPDETCTRGQMATFLWRDAGSSAVNSDRAPFVDVPTGVYFTTAVDWAYDQGITGGTSATTYSPNDPCTRGQMVTFLYRYLAD